MASLASIVNTSATSAPGTATGSQSSGATAATEVKTKEFSVKISKLEFLNFGIILVWALEGFV